AALLELLDLALQLRLPGLPVFENLANVRLRIALHLLGIAGRDRADALGLGLGALLQRPGLLVGLLAGLLRVSVRLVALLLRTVADVLGRLLRRDQNRARSPADVLERLLHDHALLAPLPASQPIGQAREEPVDVLLLVAAPRALERRSADALDARRIGVH